MAADRQGAAAGRRADGFDRAALAAYCQAWGRWVEAEERLRETPPLVKTPVRLRPAVALAPHRQQAARADGPLHGGARADAGGAQPGDGAALPRSPEPCGSIRIAIIADDRSQSAIDAGAAAATPSAKHADE